MTVMMNAWMIMAAPIPGATTRTGVPRAPPRAASMDPTMNDQLAGIELANPVGLAAGFDKLCRRLNAFGRLGFGYAVGGTITWAPREGNPWWSLLDFDGILANMSKISPPIEIYALAD